MTIFCILAAPCPREITNSGEIERWPSGLRRTLGKRVFPRGNRGFESLPLCKKKLKSLTNKLEIAKPKIQ